MRRIQVWRDAIIDVNEPVVSMSPKDYRLLLKVARAADKWSVTDPDCYDDERHARHVILAAVRALNAPAQTGRSKTK